MKEKPSIIEINNMFLEDRPLIKQYDTPETIMSLLDGEIGEWRENPTDPDELADLIVYSLFLLEALGHDPEEAIRNKIGLNMARMPAKNFQDGDFQEAYDKNREFAKEIGLR